MLSISKTKAKQTKNNNSTLMINKKHHNKVSLFIVNIKK